MATSSQGENRMCTARPRTVKATTATRSRAIIAGRVIGLRSCSCVVLMSQGCRRRLPTSIGISPDSSLRCIEKASGADPGDAGVGAVGRDGRHRGQAVTEWLVEQANAIRAPMTATQRAA